LFISNERSRTNQDSPLVHLQREIAHQPGKALEDVSHRQYANAQDRSLELAHQLIQPRLLISQQRGQGVRIGPLPGQYGGMIQRILCHSQFAYEIHQGVDALDADAQRS
jgi:hypothetical protein